MSGDEELEALRRQRLMEMQQKMTQEQQQVETEKQIQAEKQALMRRILTQKARQRLANLKMVKPTFASQLEIQLIQIAQQGRVQLPIDDVQLKEILRRLQTGRKEIRIRRV